MRSVDLTKLRVVGDEIVESEVEPDSEDTEGDRIDVCVTKVEGVDVRMGFVDSEIDENEELATRGVTGLLEDAGDEIVVGREDRDVLGWDDVLLRFDREGESGNLGLEVVFAKLNCVGLLEAPRGCSDRPACEDIND